MGSQPHSKPRIAFGPFEYDAASGDLRKHQTKLRLGGQPLLILELLLEHPNEVVGRDDLQQRLWNGKTFVDFEHGLNAAINKLRQTLGDSAEQPRYVETLPGRGYRFIGAVSYSSPRAVLEMVAANPAERVEGDGLVEAAPGVQQASVHGRRLWLAAAIIGMALLGIVGWVGTRSSGGTSAATSIAQTMRFRIAIPAGMKLSGSQTFSLSPDGRTFVYHARAKGGPMMLWAQSLDSLEPRPLVEPRSGGDAPVIWSFDSQEVAFYSEGKLKRVDLKGNPARVIGPVPGNVLGGTWGRDGTILFGTETSGILRIAASGGEPSAVTVRDAARSERLHAFPVFLGDGRHFLYSRQSAVAENTGIFVGSLDAKVGDQSLARLIATPRAAQFVERRDGSGAVLFQRDATLWAQVFDGGQLRFIGEPERVVEPIGSTRAFGFFAASSGVLIHRNVLTGVELAWFDRRGQRMNSEGLPSPPLDYFGSPLRISPDGARIALTKFDGDNVDVWVHDLTRDVTQRITFDAAIEQDPVWSPDGKRIVFSSARAGHYDLFTIGANGDGGEELLYRSSENKLATSWSGDGRFLLYSAEAGSGQRMMALPLVGPGKGQPTPVSNSVSDERSGVFSPDSKWIAYVSNESGQAEVYMRPFLASGSGGTPKVLLSRGGGVMPHWSANGKEVFYRGLDGTLQSAAVSMVPRLSVGVLQKLFASPGQGWDATASGERFLIAIPLEQGEAPFTVVLNWDVERREH